MYDEQCTSARLCSELQRGAVQCSRAIPPMQCDPPPAMPVPCDAVRSADLWRHESRAKQVAAAQGPVSPSEHYFFFQRQIYSCRGMTVYQPLTGVEPGTHNSPCLISAYKFMCCCRLPCLPCPNRHSFPNRTFYFNFFLVSVLRYNEIPICQAAWLNQSTL